LDYGVFGRDLVLPLMATQEEIEENYYVKRARERVGYNPYSGSVPASFIIDVLYLIIRLLLVIINQNQEIRRHVDRNR
jgi:hypothetical protein